ncbi:ABC transporter ATP-binding protein [Desulfosarcina ovata]|uniref:ABC transporter ATP-binding protein n=2 Tax=Desulfosarcina ovata TaxID=83564 RepID=A0A5K8AAU6_9BACT|nr:ABC transporter ATP-binding protein [Desulfosarcina ovata]BBO81847.1 ABC transporter ATP-binding protein [Desulfosarcina ovata subsp. sediminis]BBO89070.1 ABC transporter ATP-binding protein [Desulfosarcina ovata subsp. ovata]
MLDRITFDVLPGQILALLGPNGAGKSTLLKCIDGLLRPQKGCIELNGKPIHGLRRKTIARLMAYVPQTTGEIFPFKVIDMVFLGRYPHGNGHTGNKDLEKAFKALAWMGIEDLAMKDFGAISGGQQQKATIARAIAQEAEVLLLDEPTSNLDIRHQLEVMDLLRYLVKTNSLSAIITMHDLNLAARYADKVIMLENGKIVAAGDPVTALTPKTIASVYRVAVEVGSIRNKPHIIPLKPLTSNVQPRK